MSEYTPSLEFTRNLHNTVKWQDAVRKASEIFVVGYWNYMELNVLQFVRFINQVDLNHITDLNSENTTNLSRTTQLLAKRFQATLPGDNGTYLKSRSTYFPQINFACPTSISPQG
jgi:hypothetical protein